MDIAALVKRKTAERTAKGFTVRMCKTYLGQEDFSEIAFPTAEARDECIRQIRKRGGIAEIK